MSALFLAMKPIFIIPEARESQAGEGACNLSEWGRVVLMSPYIIYDAGKCLCPRIILPKGEGFFSLPLEGELGRVRPGKAPAANLPHQRRRLILMDLPA